MAQPMPSEAEIRAIARRVIEGLANTAPAQPGTTPAAPGPVQAGNGKRRLISNADVEAVPSGGTMAVPPGAVITPLARDAARERNVRLVEAPANPLPGRAANASPTAQGSSKPGPSPARGPAVQTQAAIGKAGSSQRRVAIGADHGGFALKQQLIATLGELGYGVQDCGTQSSDPVDYPDFAYAVAKLVSDGQAQFGIVVDGAGIGSCMAANKVPGVRAAMCYDISSAINSREHNNANVLTLGGGLIGPALARQIVKTWLETPFGGGRHAKRVDKITAIEKRYLKGQSGS